MFDRELFASSLSALHDALLRLHQFGMMSSSPNPSSVASFHTGGSSFAVGFAVTAIAGVAVAVAVGGTLLYSRRSRHRRRKKKRFPLTQKQWRDAFDAETGRLVGVYKILKKIRLGGVEPSIRAEVWPFLLGFYELGSTQAEREMEKSHKRKAYEDLKRQCNLLRERTYKSSAKSEGSSGSMETDSKGTKSAVEEVWKEAARNFPETLQSATDDTASGLDSSRQDTNVDCKGEPLIKVQGASIENIFLNGTEIFTTCVEATDDHATSGLDGRRCNAEGHCQEELMNNASVNDSCLNTTKDIITCEKVTKDAAAMERDNSREYTKVHCNEKALNKGQDADSCLEVWEDVIACAKGTDDDTSSRLDCSRGSTEEDYKEDPLNNIHNASIEDSSMEATEDVSTCVKANEDDGILGLDNRGENTEEVDSEEPLTKVQDGSIEDSCQEAGEDVIIHAKDTEDDAPSDLDSSVGNIDRDCKEKVLKSNQDASIEDSSLEVTEDVITWQRIIRLDAVRMNAEWVPYSSTQASVTGEVAQELATTVGLKDDEHLEPCRQHHAARLVAILEAYALYDSETGYCQGMSDLLSPFVALLDDDYEAFWCFVQFMNTARYNFRKDEIGIRRQLDQIRRILKASDPHLYRHLEVMHAQECFFVYRMVVVLMRRELSFEQTISLWEVIWAEKRAVKVGDVRFSQRRGRRKTLPTDDLLLYVIAAVVRQRRNVIIQNCSGMDEILRECNSMAGNLDVWALLDDARDLESAMHGQILG